MLVTLVLSNRNSARRRARNLRNLRTIFHHRDEGPARRQNSVNLAWHQASGGARRQRNEMEIGGIQRLAKLLQRLIRHKSYVVQPHCARPFLEPILARAFTDYRKQNSVIIPHPVSRLEHAFELL